MTIKREIKMKAEGEITYNNILETLFSEIPQFHSINMDQKWHEMDQGEKALPSGNSCWSCRWMSSISNQPASIKLRSASKTLSISGPGTRQKVQYVLTKEARN